MSGPVNPLTSRKPEAYGCGIGVLLGVMFSFLLVAFLFWISGSGLGRFWRGVFGDSRTQILVGQPTVVLQIQQLQRMETVVFTLEKIMVGERESPVLPMFLAGDRLLLIVHGEVIAGVDLAKVKSEDVTASGRTIKVRLPRAEIFTTRVDNENTRVYSRDTGLFSRVDPQLESEVRREGERQLRAAALKNNILETAEQNARRSLTGLLKGFGFEHPEIQ